MDAIFRALPNFKGKTRLARWVFGHGSAKTQDITVKGKWGCSYRLPNIAENVGFEIFIHGAYEPESQDLLVRRMPKNGVFFDLGANIGSIIVPLCVRRPDVSAVAVEAAPWIFEYLQHNLSLNGLDRVKLVKKALYDQDDLTLQFYMPKEKFGKGSLAPVFTSEGSPVTTITVDSLLRESGHTHIDMIKIDVEGFEYFVFKGGESILRAADAPEVFFEFVDWAEAQANGLKPGDAQRLLLDSGYHLYRVDGDRLIPLRDVLTEGNVNLLATKKQP